MPPDGGTESTLRSAHFGGDLRVKSLTATVRSKVTQNQGYHDGVYCAPSAPQLWSARSHNGCAAQPTARRTSLFGRLNAAIAPKRSTPPTSTQLHGCGAFPFSAKCT